MIVIVWLVILGFGKFSGGKFSVMFSRKWWYWSQEKQELYVVVRVEVEGEIRQQFRVVVFLLVVVSVSSG